MSGHVYCWQLELAPLKYRLVCVASDHSPLASVLLSDQRTRIPLASYLTLHDYAFDFCVHLVNLVRIIERFPTHLEIEASLLEVES